MSIALQSESVNPVGHILVNGQKVASFSTTGGLSATFDNNTINSQAIQTNAITTEKLLNNSVTTEKIVNNAITVQKLDSIGQGSGNPPIYACRAWVKFNGVTGQIYPGGSGNVSSITKVTTGQYRVNFAVPLATKEYSACGSTNEIAEANRSSGWCIRGNTDSPFMSTTYLEIDGGSKSSGGAFDMTVLNVQIFA